MASEDKRNVLITGCSSGIGAATARAFREAGWQVWATARRPETLAELEAAGCRTLALDVTDSESMKAAVDAVVAEHGAVGCLVNNAGYSQSGAVESVPMDRVRRQFETNVFGMVELTQLVLPGMRERGWGKVVNVSSMGGTLTFPGGGVYHASKYAVEALSDALRFEVRGFGVDVICIQPGLILSGFTERLGAAMTEVDKEEGPYGAFNQHVAVYSKKAYTESAMARLSGTPEDVARAILSEVEKSRPRARVPVTWSATVLMAQRRWLPDWAWDYVMGTIYPTP